MITNTGKNILAKYLIGQAPAYASYIAVGCGAKPLASDYVFTQTDIDNYAAKQHLDFEMFRVPITSRGYVTEEVDGNSVSKIVFTAELPTEERYEITEVGLYSAGSNPAAGAYDSKTVYAFNSTEGWEYHDQVGATQIPLVYEPLDQNGDDGVITQTSPVFQTNSDNTLFADPVRVARHERCRFLNNIIMIAGNDSNLSISGNDLIPQAGSNHIHLTGISLDFNKNAPTDELLLSFSVANKDVADTSYPDSVRILVEFLSSDVSGSGQYAKFATVVNHGTGAGQNNFATNRYLVSSVQLQELIRSTEFTWNAVNTVKIYASAVKAGLPSSNYYIGLDAIRLENKNSTNPLYGMSGYSVIKNSGSLPIVKEANTTNYIEFRFAMDVQ